MRIVALNPHRTLSVHEPVDKKRLSACQYTGLAGNPEFGRLAGSSPILNTQTVFPAKASYSNAIARGTCRLLSTSNLDIQGPNFDGGLEQGKPDGFHGHRII
jgi:hypothetical protein